VLIVVFNPAFIRRETERIVAARAG
jgi:hypothetical protein